MLADAARLKRNTGWYAEMGFGRHRIMLQNQQTSFGKLLISNNDPHAHPVSKFKQYVFSDQLSGMWLLPRPGNGERASAWKRRTAGLCR